MTPILIEFCRCDLDLRSIVLSETKVGCKQPRAVTFFPGVTLRAERSGLALGEDPAPSQTQNSVVTQRLEPP